MQALLELKCMPAGMELFPAANDTQWNWIKKVIDESDYYIVIVAGRYGTVSKESGQSYTEMEYRYAVEAGKPVIGFLHEDISKIPSKFVEQSARIRNKLDLSSVCWKPTLQTLQFSFRPWREGQPKSYSTAGAAPGNRLDTGR